MHVHRSLEIDSSTHGWKRVNRGQSGNQLVHVLHEMALLCMRMSLTSPRSFVSFLCVCRQDVRNAGEALEKFMIMLCLCDLPISWAGA